MTAMQAAILETRKSLEKTAHQVVNLKALVGFDGFIDEICDLVDKRTGLDSYERIETIESFATRLARAAGLSTNIEVVPKTVKLGGNGPIMSNALVSFGVKVTYAGGIGKGSVNPVFEEFAKRCEKVYPISEPGHTDALEFTDGKVMMGKVEPMKELTWENLLTQVEPSELVRLFADLNLAALVNWTMIPYMNDIWESLLSEVLPKVPRDTEEPIFFFDLADPEKRKDSDIRDAINIIRKFSAHGRVVLGLNRKEASEIAVVLGIKLSDEPAKVSLQEVTEAVASALGLYCLVVHPTAKAAAVVSGVYHEVEGPFTSKPKLTTGAGDNFNAGFVLALSLGLPPTQALVCGVATSGFYVRNMHSPNLEELLGFLELWSTKVGQDF